MTPASTRREVPTWLVVVVLGVVLVVVAAIGIRMFRPATPAATVTRIGPSSNAAGSYLSHYTGQGKGTRPDGAPGRSPAAGYLNAYRGAGPGRGPGGSAPGPGGAR